ncbi:MAG TPA: phosphoenolpyruvate-utilizing N-terminal domain-containing protein, partial [Burkholderiales bacterium]|nr:phosphoenolpyruvate-utilizing N-terminal domain-containing protein [Burkholderiales bacterium]
MSFTMHGIPVSGGIAIGHAHLVSHARLEVAHYAVPAHQVGEEVARFDTALATVRAELEELRTQIPTNAPQEFDAFLNLHLMILNDATLSKTPREIIETEQCIELHFERPLRIALFGFYDMARRLRQRDVVEYHQV